MCPISYLKYGQGNRGGPVSARDEFIFCSYGKFKPGCRVEVSARLLLIWEIFQLGSETNKSQPFKFHPGNRAGVFIWENF